MLGGIAVAVESVNFGGRLVYYITLITGGAGFVLGTIGCIGLLVKRITDTNLKTYTRRIDYINLLFVLAVLLTGFFAWILTDFTFAIAREYMYGLVTFSPVGNIEPIIATHIILLGLLLAYMPFTNMMHFFAKFFTYHMVRWDDVPNLRGSKLGRELGPLFNQPINWSAPHIKPDIQCWGDIPKVITEQHTARTQKGE